MLSKFQKNEYSDFNIEVRRQEETDTECVVVK